jgi:hypothetical protein
VQRLVELVPLGVVVYGRDDLGGILRRQRSERVVAVPEDVGIVALVESGFGPDEMLVGRLPALPARHRRNRQLQEDVMIGTDRLQDLLHPLGTRDRDL